MVEILLLNFFKFSIYWQLILMAIPILIRECLDFMGRDTETIFKWIKKAFDSKLHYFMELLYFKAI
jgi:hypothetical protein